MYSDFSTQTHGKWILAGEHAVVRGHSALVFPVVGKKLELNFYTSASGLTADFRGEHGKDLQLLFWSVLEHGLNLLNQSLNQVRGHFDLFFDIPIGAGMGASAALCVAMSRWFSAQGFLPTEQMSSFAQQLENMFHGKSSGLDIAGASSTNPVVFQQGKSTPFQPTWKPNWYLSSCGQIGITAHCIQIVQTLWQDNSEKAKGIDEQMHASVVLAQKALVNDSKDSFSMLCEAINHACDCFYQWGLVSESLHQHMNTLRTQGAVAVKPTGSGVGGFVLSLWSLPPNTMKESLIPV